ncbi:WecB/TagA/CpsF family glycosyltransferase [Novosphingobium sp. RD2P27]|uniref:WecB/TagA/CpsF family glycosyltransferase n=1 Tax=Novosphingobium kalidii TaxID=3230299 RepID=A0ABV2D1R7_9SPHN
MSLLGFTVDCTDLVETAQIIAASPQAWEPGARIYVTPNIQHVAEMRRNSELQRAVREADLVTCDGFPIVSYARFSGVRIPGRITGREVVKQLMLHTQFDRRHVLVFLIDSEETAGAIRTWAAQRGLSQQVFAIVAPPRFGEDDAACARLAEHIAALGTTILFLGVGAPKSEIFASRYRLELGNCWVLCIGQAVRVALGLVRQPPRLCVMLHAEWAWRLALEPRRLWKRYVSSAAGFAAAILDDVRSQVRKRVL